VPAASIVLAAISTVQDQPARPTTARPGAPAKPLRGPVSGDGMAIRGDTHWRLRCATGRFGVDQGISCTLAALCIPLSSSPGNRPSHRPSMARRLRCANDGFATPIWLSGRQRPRRTLTDTGRTCWLTGKASTAERFGYREGETTLIEFRASRICSARPRRRRAVNTPAASPG
jgi:hypothetical protein